MLLPTRRHLALVAAALSCAAPALAPQVQLTPGDGLEVVRVAAGSPFYRDPTDTQPVWVSGRALTAPVGGQRGPRVAVTPRVIAGVLDDADVSTPTLWVDNGALTPILTGQVTVAWPDGSAITLAASLPRDLPWPALTGDVVRWIPATAWGTRARVGAPPDTAGWTTSNLTDWDRSLTVGGARFEIDPVEVQMPPVEGSSGIPALVAPGGSPVWTASWDRRLVQVLHRSRLVTVIGITDGAPPTERPAARPGVLRGGPGLRGAVEVVGPLSWPDGRPCGMDAATLWAPAVTGTRVCGALGIDGVEGPTLCAAKQHAVDARNGLPFGD